MKKANIVLRAAAATGTLGVLVTGVTFAALQSSATLSDNTISSATAGLQVKGPTSTGFSASEPGFKFTGLIPGADYGAGLPFSLKNTGDAPEAIAVTSTTGTQTGGTVDTSKIHVKVTNLTTSHSTETTLADFATLFNNLPDVSGTGSLAAGATADFNVQIKGDADSVTGSGASLSGFDLVFTGTATGTNPE